MGSGARDWGGCLGQDNNVVDCGEWVECCQVLWHHHPLMSRRRHDLDCSGHIQVHM